MNSFRYDTVPFATKLRDLLIEHLEAPVLVDSAGAHSQRRRALRELLHRAWIISDGRFTHITLRGREKLEELLTDYAGAMTRVAMVSKPVRLAVVDAEKPRISATS